MDSRGLDLFPLQKLFFENPDQSQKELQMGEMIQLKAADGFLASAYVARPKAAPRGAVVVLQEIFGVNAHVKAVADGFALAGYLSVAPATFDRVEKGVNLGYDEPDRNKGFALKNQVEALPAPGALADVQAAIDWAALNSRGRVGVVGYCWGGLLTWRSACLLNGVAAAVPYYGGGVTSEAESARMPKCPVMAHFGERDHYIPLDGVHAFAKAHPDVDVPVYPADHGFNCDHRGSYDEASANQALERTLGFFLKHLG